MLERPVSLRVLSLGAGVQSTTMALMAAAGEIEPMPDLAIFADTGAEPAAVYRHLDWLEAQLPFPVVRVVAPFGHLGPAVAAAYANGTVRTASPPFFTANPRGMLPRQCTKEAKVRPIIAEIRRRLGVEPKARVGKDVRVVQWIGISTDEAHRMKPAEQAWVEHQWPLIDHRMSRSNCKGWLARHGYPTPPKSACVWCPYHSDETWRWLKAEAPDDFAEAVRFDAAVRRGGRGMRGEVYVHRSCKPLDQVEFAGWDKRGQPDLFGNECEGMCGV
jgi:hypothetical protein